MQLLNEAKVDSIATITGVTIDYQSIVKLKSKVSHFFVPLGVSAHLIRWGVPKENITELNWWEETKYQGLTVALTPARHFSGREPFNIDTTLWGLSLIHISEPTRRTPISYAVFCLKKKKKK